MGKMLEYERELVKDGIDPKRKYHIEMEISELELNALEDLLFTDLPKEEKEIVEEICRGLFLRMLKKLR